MNLAIFTVGVQAFYLWFSMRSVGASTIRVSWNLDLLDLRPLAPIERERTTVALVGILMISFMSLTTLPLIQRAVLIQNARSVTENLICQRGPPSGDATK